MLNKEIPFLRLIIPLCCGIIAGRYIDQLPLLVIATAVLCILLPLTSLFFKNQINILFGLFLNLILLLTGFLMYGIEKNRITPLSKDDKIIICTLSDFPDEKEKSSRVIARLLEVIENNSTKPAGGSILLYIKNDSTPGPLFPGDILKIYCRPFEIRNRGNPCEFDYKSYMENKGIRYQAYIDREDILDHIVPENRNIRYQSLIIREKIIEMYRNRGIKGRNLALVAAMTVGEKTLLEPEQKESFIRAGVMHIMAVSGLHAVVLSLFVFNILFFLKGRLNILRIITALLILWAFAFVTGLTPSVMRATLMFSFIQAGKLMKRPVNSMNSVLASAFVLLIIRPTALFDAGFLLSYSAVIFIIAFYKDLYSALQPKSILTDRIWQSAAITLVAQAGTLSLTIMFFNRFPAYFLLTNLVIVPLSSLIIIFGCLIPMFYPLKFLSEFLAVLLNNITGLTQFLTEKAAALPGSSIDRIGMTAPECILIYCIIALLCTILIRREFRFINHLLVLVLLLSVFSSARHISLKRTNELIVYNTPGSTTVGIRTGRAISIYTDHDMLPPDVIRHCSTLGLRIKNMNLINGITCMQAGQSRLLISDRLNKELLTAASPDIVILEEIRPFINSDAELEKFSGMLVVTSGTGSGFRIPVSSSPAINREVHLTRQSGALIMRLN